MPNILDAIIDVIRQPNPLLRAGVQQDIISAIAGEPVKEKGSSSMPRESVKVVAKPKVPKATVPTVPEEKAPESTEKKNNFWRILARFAPTLLATGIGSTSSRALPGAAGFTKGYEDELATQRERKFEKEKLEEVVEAKKEKADASARQKAIDSYNDLYAKAQETALKSFGTDMYGQKKDISPAELAERTDAILANIMSKYGVGERKGGEQKVLTKPDFVDQKDWDAAPDSEKQELLEAYNLL